ILDSKLSEIQDAMENKMKSYTLLDIQKGIKEI
ncbi:MAG: transcriptional regulator, partial [Lachnospiraceae bacterium]